MNIDVNLNDAADVTCSECECIHFTAVVRLKRISPVISPTGEAIIVPIQLWECRSCGLVDESIMT